MGTRQLQGAFPAGRGQPAVRPDPDEPGGPAVRLTTCSPARGPRRSARDALPADRQPCTAGFHRGRLVCPSAAGRRACSSTPAPLHAHSSAPQRDHPTAAEMPEPVSSRRRPACRRCRHELPHIRRVLMDVSALRLLIYALLRRRPSCPAGLAIVIVREDLLGVATGPPRRA